MFIIPPSHIDQDFFPLNFLQIDILYNTGVGKVFGNLNMRVNDIIERERIYTRQVAAVKIFEPIAMIKNSQRIPNIDIFLDSELCIDFNFQNSPVQYMPVLDRPSIN